MRAYELLASLLLCVALVVVGLVSAIPAAVAQSHADDFGFAPPTAVPTPTREKPKKRVVLSFTRYESDIRDLCNEIAEDGRRDRIEEVSAFASRSPAECPSCRVLWRVLERVCRDKAARKARLMAATKTQQEKKESGEATDADDESTKEEDEEPDGGAEKEAAGEPEEAATDEAEGDDAEESDEDVDPEATPTPRPALKQRRPSAVVIDMASRLSTTLYERERDGYMYETVDRITDMLERYDKPTEGEEEYFGILREYLLAAWAGREVIITPAPQHEEENVDDLFE